jgi:signal transduction histidine kinase
MRGRFHVPMFVIAGALLGLLVLLATVQYRWLGRISDAERERMKATLNTRAVAFATDVDRELTRAYLLFQADQLPPDGENVAARIAARYDRWQATARFPKLIKEIDVVPAGDEPGLQRFDPASRFLSPVEWPDSLAELRRQLSAQRVGPAPDGPMVLRTIPAPLLEPVPALIVPTPLMIMNGREGSPNLGVLPSLSYTVLLLDADYMQREMIPSLAQQHFRGTGDGFDYELAVVRASNNALVYHSSTDFTPKADAAADASVGLFQVRTQDFGALAAEVRRFATFVTTAPRGQMVIRKNVSPKEGRTSVVFEERVESPAGRGSPITGLAANATTRASLMSTPHWRLLVKHPSGSLERAVSTARRRNLVVSSSILAVLAVSLGFLVVSTRRAQELARRQMEFVAAVSHELRTPLAVIRSAADNLADGVVHDEAQVQKYGELVRGEGRRLTQMVEQILDFAGIQSGQRGMSLRPVHIRPLLEEVIGASRALIDDAGITVDVSVPETLPAVLGDQAALRRVLQNLVGNAIKYGAGGGWIGIEADASGREVRLVIADKGIGIDAAQHARIFEPFYRAPEVIAAQIQGAGLGLSLVQRIVESHGGRVTVQSAPGTGSTFTVHLPAASGEAVGRLVSEAQSSASPAPHHT